MLSLTINGVDFTSKWRLYESRWTSRAFMGESFQSEFVIDDDDGTIDHADLASQKIVEVWEDASGDDVCMFRGRVANKTLARGTLPTDSAMRWTVSVEDANIELRDIRVSNSHRAEESDRGRFLAFRAAYLNGASSTNAHARDSTELDGGFVVNADLVTVPEEDYTDTYPHQVFGSICDLSAKTFFVFTDDAGQGQLYYASHTDTSYSSDIAITDAGTADGIDSYTPYVGVPTGEHDGQRVITGGSVRYGDDQYYEASDIGGSEAAHDKKEEHFTDEYINSDSQAQSFLEGIVASRSNEDFTYVATIDMRAEHAHRIKAGMQVPVRIVSANKPASDEQRAVQVTHEPQHPDEDGEATYKVTIEFGIPRGRPFRRNIRRKPTAKKVAALGRDSDCIDTFHRSVESGWGAAGIGNLDWGASDNGTHHVLGNAGTLTAGADSASMWLDWGAKRPFDGTDLEFVAKVAVSGGTATGQGQYHFFLGTSDGTVDPEGLDMDGGSNTFFDFELNRDENDGDLHLANWYLAFSDGDQSISVAQDEQFWWKCKVTATELQSKVWVVGDAEPAYQCVATTVGGNLLDILAESVHVFMVKVIGESLPNSEGGTIRFSSLAVLSGMDCGSPIHGGADATAGDSDDAAPVAHEHDYVATGGTTGQHLVKTTDADFDTEWEDMPTPGGDSPFQEIDAASWELKPGINTLTSEGGLGESALFMDDTEVFLSAENGVAGFYATYGYTSVVTGIGAVTFDMDGVKHYLNNGAGVVVPQQSVDADAGDSQDGQIMYNNATDTFRGRKRGVWEDIGTPSYVSIAKWGD